ncbi:MAG TPA: hypothetical protein VF600_13780 [Abditibacteriaceae bacterium]|jgi:hypothetical protein
MSNTNNGGKMTSPVGQTSSTYAPTTPLVVAAGESISIAVTPVQDIDQWTQGQSSGTEADSITYTFSVEDAAGTVMATQSLTDTTSVTWIMNEGDLEERVSAPKLTATSLCIKMIGTAHHSNRHHTAVMPVAIAVSRCTRRFRSHLKEHLWLPPNFLARPFHSPIPAKPS